MKILTITIHNVPNFGSVLQTLATQLLFERKKCSIETIDYCPPRLRMLNRIKYIWRGKGSFVKKIATFLSMDVFNGFVFKSFLKRRVKMTKRVYCTKDIEKKLIKADLYLTGSDQVWNSEHNQFVNPTYYFYGISAKKASFSSSFGRLQLPEEEKSVVKSWLDDYKLISVRENSGVEILREMYPQKRIEQLLDPTLLISAEEWRKIASCGNRERERYVLIYPMSAIDYRLFEIARRVSENIGAPVKMLSPGLKRYKQCETTLRFQSPERFLELIDNATCVVTNSFHGTAFSINLETPFISLMPQKFSTRLQSILTLLKLTDRIWTENFDYSKTLMIDFSKPQEILNAERVKASNYIDEVVSL